MTVRPRRLVMLCGVVPTVVIAVLSLYRPLFLSSLEHNVDDTLMRAVRTHPPDSRIVIVDIDDHSLSTIGQWPWRRDIVGNLITRLRELGAKVVALDVVFAESDRYAGTGAATDEALSGALRPGRVVLGYVLTFDGARRDAGACVMHPLGLAVSGQGDLDPFFRATGVICSLPMLTRAAGASGFLNATPDADGILRRVPLLLEFDGHVYPALALAAVSAATGTRDVAIRVSNVNASSLMLDSRNVPLDGKSNLLVRYRGRKHTFPYFSAADVLGNRTPADAFNGKIVLVGTTALGTREVVATPFDTLFAGVEVQATVADNLLQRDFIGRPENGVALETLLVLALGFVTILLVGRFGLGWGAPAVAGCLAALWAGTITLLSADGALLSPLFPTIGGVCALAAISVAQFTIERGRADRAGRAKDTSQRLMVQTLLSLTEVRDAETGRHSRRTQRCMRILAEQLATCSEFREYLAPERIDLMASLAPLHDIGKVGVPDRVLNKPGALTPEELAEMRKHPAHGRDVIVNAERKAGAKGDAVLAMAKDIVYTHHEKWDGSGYPQGLRGTEIPIAGRLMAIVDVYDAVLNRRLYQQPMSHDDTVAVIVKGRGTHFDPAVVDAFVKVSDVLRGLSADGD
jgi:CHASE2 domain-containing sensor protein